MTDGISTELQAVIARIDSNLSELKREASLIKRYNRSLATQIEASANEMVETFANNLKIAISEPKEGVRTLTSVCDLIENARARYLQQFLEEAINKVRRKLSSPFWIGSQVDALNELDDLEREIDSSKLASLPTNETLGKLNSTLHQFEAMIRKLEQGRQFSRTRTPMKTMLWGLPIWIGIAFSNRLGILGNLICFVILAGASFLTFMIASRKTLTSIQGDSRSTKTPSLQLSKMFGRRTYLMLLIYVALIPLALAIPREPRASIASFLMPDPAVISIENRIEGRPGDVVSPNLTIGSKEGTLFRVRATVESPMLNDPFQVETSAINGPSQVVPLQVTIPKDAPPGIFPATLKVSYDLDSTSFLYSGYITKSKTIELKLSVTE